MNNSALLAENHIPDSVLSIFLGYACNLSCSYCLQHKNTEPTTARDISDEDLQLLIQEYKRRGFNGVAYWGGEPTLYWDKIVRIHEALRSAGLDLTFVKFVTNGTLITDKQVEILNEWGAYVVISHHPQFGTPNWEVLRSLARCSVSFLFTKRNPEIWPFFQFLEELRAKYRRIFFPYMHWVRATKDCSVEDRFTFEDLAAHRLHLYDLANRRLAGDMLAHSSLEGSLLIYSRDMKSKSLSPLCFGDRKLAIDLEGKVYTCHHAPIEANRIFSHFSSREQTPQQIQVVKEASKFVNSSECQSCRLRYYCKGNCHLSQTHAVDCALMKIKAEVFDYILTNEA